MIRRAAVMIVAAAALAGCSTPTAPGEIGAVEGTRAPDAPPGQSDIETELDCYLIDTANYSAGRGATEEQAVAELRGWYPPIARTMRWPDAPPTTWLLFRDDGRGYGTATVSQPDPTVEEWSASVKQLCVAVVPPLPSDYTDLTGDGRAAPDSLAAPANAEFLQAMSTAILGLPQGDAADALKAVGWRVRVGERDGVPQDNVGSDSSWINLVIAAGNVTGFTIG